MPKRITHEKNGQLAISLTVDFLLTKADIKHALVNEIISELSGTDNQQVVKDYTFALTRKRVDEKVRRWLYMNGLAALSRSAVQPENEIYYHAIDDIVDRIYPEL